MTQNPDRHSPLVDKAIAVAEYVAGQVLHDPDLEDKAKLHEQRAEATIQADALDADAAIAQEQAAVTQQLTSAQIAEQRSAIDAIDAKREREVANAVRAAQSDVDAEREEREQVADRVKQVQIADIRDEDSDAKRLRANEHREAHALEEQADVLRAEALSRANNQTDTTHGDPR